MYILSLNMWFQEIMRQFFFNIDTIVFGFIEDIYDLLITISRTSVLSQSQILDMSDRVYKLLAVFMIFKVTFSLIMYVVNPDDFSDKTKGVGKLGANIIISLSLLILTPYIFNMAFRFQAIVLEDNSLGTLIFGEEDTQGVYNSAGQKIAFAALQPFFTPNVSIDELNECVYIGEACYKQLEDIIDDNMLENYKVGNEHNSMYLVFRQALALETYEASLGGSKEEVFVMNYKYVFSTVVGVIIVLMLLSFCIDVAIRSIKLSFLQLVAPIPIISYIDPKSGKDGLFKKWYQMCFKTYISLFVRLLALYFGVYIIDLVVDSRLVDIVDGTYVTNSYVVIFIIIGALMFVKQLPKILEGLGIKLDGDQKFTLNPLKKISEGAIGGKQILGAGKGLVAGTMIGAAGMMSGAGLGRSISGAFGGMISGIQGKKFGEIRKDQVNKNAEMRRAIASGSSFWDRRGAQLSGYFGLPGELGHIEHDKIAIQNRIDDLNAEKKEIDNRNAPIRRRIKERSEVSSTLKAMQDRGVSKVKQGHGEAGGIYQGMLQDAAALDAQAQHETDSLVAARLAKQAEAKRQEAEKYANTTGRDSWITANMNSDEELMKLRSKYDRQVAQVAGKENIFENPAAYTDENGNPLSTAGSIDSQGKELSREVVEDQNSILDTEREIQVLDERIKTEQETLDELNAEEKRAKSNVQATHSTEGGPAHPSDIKPAESTVGRRSGGPGSGSPHGGPGSGSPHGGPGRP